MIELVINGKTIQAQPRTTILQAALANGIYIPHLCWDRRLVPYGGCRLCLVEVEGMHKFLASCSTPVKAGMNIHTETPKLEKARRTVLELLLVHHPLDCPVCDKAGECDLQDLAFKYGPVASRFADERKHEPESTTAPLIERNANRCILCGKCVRICTEHQGVGALNLIGRGFKTKVSPAFEETLDCEFCGQCVDACPVGALGTKPYKFRSRVWFMEEQENICPYCSVGCTSVLSLRDGRILRARGKDGVGISKGDLCPRGRFGFDFIDSEHRLKTPLIRKESRLEPASWAEALDFTAKRLMELRDAHGPRSIGALGSERCSVEDNYMLKKFMGMALGSANVDSRTRFGYLKQVAALKKTFGIDKLAMDLEAPMKADVIFVLESDLTSTHPVYGLKAMAAQRNAGATLMVADPRETKLSRWSSLWLRIRPATGAALVNGIMSALIEGDLHDKKAESVKGFGELKEHLEKYTLTAVSGMTGVPEAVIGQAAGELASAKNPMLMACFGSSENTKGENAALALMDLAILLGRGPEALGLPPEFANTLGTQLALGTGGKGLDAMEMMYGGRMKAMYIMGENPLVTFPDSARVENTLGALELLVVQDIMMTATAKMAHVVLPASGWGEKEGTFVGMTGRPQKIAKCLAEIGQSKPDWKILRELGKIMHADLEKDAKTFSMLSETALAGIGLAGQGQETAHLSLSPAFVPAQQETAEAAGAAYPLIFATGNLMQHSGSLTTISNNLDSAAPDAYLQINPSDAEAHHIYNEGYVKVIGRNGESVYLKARVTEEVPAGMLFTTAHFAHARVNLLTQPPRNGEAPTVAVKIEPA